MYINLVSKLNEAVKAASLCRCLMEGEDIEGKCADMLLENNKGQFLLLLRPDTDDLFPGKWCLPGGHRKDDETIKQGAIRECHEESGIKVNDAEKLLNWTYPDGFKTTIFHARQPFQFEDTTVKLSDEHVNFKWCSVDEIKKLDLAGDLLEPLLKAIDMVQ